MAQSVPISDKVWQELSQLARKRRVRPQTLLTQLIRDYLEMEADRALFEEMATTLSRQVTSDEEAVDLVHQIRRERQS